MFKEFKEFISKGNVIDLAVGVIIGAAFGKIVTSMVADIFMPLLGLLTGGIKFADRKFQLSNLGLTPLELEYGKFVQSIFDFMVIAIALFLAIKLINRLRRKKEEEPATPPAPPEDVALLREIRDLLREKR